MAVSDDFHKRGAVRCGTVPSAKEGHRPTTTDNHSFVDFIVTK